jgi:hypothetical protein
VAVLAAIYVLLLVNHLAEAVVHLTRFVFFLLQTIP